MHTQKAEISSTANPLLTPVYQILRQNQAGLSEYALLTSLQKAGYRFPATTTVSAELALFRKHFVLMNALYQLHERLWDEGVHLHISPLLIRMESLSADQRTETGESSGYGADVSTDHRHGALRAYYLDWRHFQESTDESVTALLDSFWRGYQHAGDHRAALNTLGLDADQKRWPEIKQAYQRQARRHHPDRGGDSQRFQAIREAYETLALHYKPVHQDKPVHQPDD